MLKKIAIHKNKTIACHSAFNINKFLWRHTDINYHQFVQSKDEYMSKWLSVEMKIMKIYELCEKNIQFKLMCNHR